MRILLDKFKVVGFPNKVIPLIISLHLPNASPEGKLGNSIKILSEIMVKYRDIEYIKEQAQDLRKELVLINETGKIFKKVKDENGDDTTELSNPKPIENIIVSVLEALPELLDGNIIDDNIKAIKKIGSKT